MIVLSVGDVKKKQKNKQTGDYKKILNKLSCNYSTMVLDKSGQVVVVRENFMFFVVVLI